MDLSIIPINDINSLVLTLIVIGIGYVSLFLGYRISSKQKDFLKETTIKSTDKVIISFLIGSFSYMVLLSTFSTELAISDTSFNFDTLIKLLLFILILIAIFSYLISLMVKDKKKKRKQHLKHFQ
ncbi:MAG: hypothetical protein K0B07_03500 [DPANN group archaeon]|nr:hypothetical protein [DPANN group archaeon]